MKINAILNINSLKISEVEEVVSKAEKNQVNLIFNGSIQLAVSELDTSTEQGASVLALLKRMPVVQAKTTN